jgi:tRNA G18 (ribose-2'-O)-methylase SpoU
MVLYFLPLAPYFLPLKNMKKLNITEMNRLTVEEFKEEKKTPLVVVLDNVRSLHNVGSVFRTADAFLVEAVYLCGITSTPPQAEIHKTALGAENTVDWKYYEDTHVLVNELKEQGYTVFAIEQAAGSTKLPNLKLDSVGKYAVILGNEVKGVQQSVVDACDGCIEIPQFGTKHSLNVSVTGGIIIWEFFKLIQNA